MIIAPRRLFALGVFALAVSAASAQEPLTPLDRFLAHVDFGLAGAGEFTTNTSGTAQNGQPVSLRPSTTLGVLVNLRYLHSPFIGGEFNYERARYTQDFTFNTVSPTGTTQLALGVQNNATEYTFGYVVHTPKLYSGVQPFASAGLGTVAFRPTNGGGEGNLPQARAAYYYNLGAETSVLNPHLGLRLGFRQVFSNAPDFQETYWRDHKHQVASEPYAGVYIRF